MPAFSNELERAISTALGQSQRVRGVLGFNIQGTYSVIVPNEPNKFYVRVVTGEVVKAFHRSRVPPTPDLPVFVVTDKRGATEIVDVDWTRAIMQFGAQASTMGVGIHTHARFSGMEFPVDGRLLASIRARMMGNLTIGFDSGIYSAGGVLRWWSGSTTIDLTSHRPSSGMQQRWVIVSIDTTSTPTLVATDGTDQPTAVPLTMEQMVSLVDSLDLNHVPLLAVKLRGGQATIVELDVESLINIHAVNPASGIAINDGTVTVDPAVQLTFDPDFFSVVDGGGGVAQVTFTAEIEPPSVAYSSWDPEAPPETPHAYDDEFEGAVGGSWVDYDHGSLMTYAAAPGKGVRMVFSQGATAWAGLLRSVSIAGDFSVMTRIRVSFGTSINTKLVGLIFAEGTASTSNFYTWMIVFPAITTVAAAQIHEYSAYGTFVAAPLAHNVSHASLHLDFWLRVRRISGTYYCDISPDGKSWLQIGSNAFTNLSALNYIGIGGAVNNASGGTMYVTYDFFRVSTDVTLDTPVHGQAIAQLVAP